MINRVCIPYLEAEKFIQEGYILLFRGNSIISKFIQAFTFSEYSHVGIASWANGRKDPILECLEFRELKGSRAVNLKLYVEQNPGIIDVFAPDYMSTTQYYDIDQKYVKVIQKKFNGRAITRDFRRHIGKPYSYYQILNILWYRIPLLRLISNPDNFKDIEDDTLEYAICSSAVSAFYSRHYADLVRFQSSAYTSPADISRSPLLSYLFTLVP